jgi:tetratricopeptide (TPR) repeat protein
MHELLLRLGYHETSVQNIIDEIDNLFNDIGFDELEKKAHDAINAKYTEGLISVLNELMKRLENKGIYRPDYPTVLIKLIVNGLNNKNEDIFSILEESSLSTEEIKKEQEFLASCAAITQLGYIMIYRIIGEVNAASSGPHVFILIDHFTPDSMIFVDFSIDSILEIDAKQYEKVKNYYSLKAQASDDKTSKHIAQYYSYFHAVSGIGLSHNIHNNIGIAYDKAGMHEEAISEFNEALRFMPGYLEAHCNLGSIYASSGRFKEALAEFNVALSINPESVLVHNNLGNFYIEQEKFHEAILAFQEAVKIDPELPEAYCGMGSAYYELGSFDKSAQAWIRAVHLAPELVECVPEKLLLKVKRAISRVE